MTLKDNIIMENKITEKEMVDPGATSEREEGEISDLDLEDVSDCSLSSNKSYHKGYQKSRQARDTLYFSCVSENDSDSDVIPSSLGCTQCRSYNCDGFQCAYKLSHRNHHGKRRRYKYKCGKSKSRVVILSCDSNSDKEIIQSNTPHRISSSDSEDESVDRSLLVKLNKAVRVNTPATDQLQTSLRTRLKKMIDHDEGKSSDSEYELMELRKLALESKLRECAKHEKSDDNEIINLSDAETFIPIESTETTPTPKSEVPSVVTDTDISSTKDDITDAEAQQLRLDALRSAVLKKHELRRQKQNISCDKQTKIIKPDTSHEPDDVSIQIKTVINDLLDYIITDNNSSDSSISNENKNEVSVENNKENEENPSPQPVPVKSLETPSKTVDEDEDILRAMLLTSIAKKISEENIPKQVPEQQNTVKTLKNQKTMKTQTYQKPDNHKNKTVNVHVKPLVINVGEDSETDEDSPVKSKNDVSIHFERSLSQLLKEARANAEKQQATSSTTKMPSAVQRLPESRQAEYLQLKNRLEQLKQNQKAVTKLNKLQKMNKLPTQINLVKKIPTIAEVQKNILNKPQRMFSKKLNRFTANDFQFFNKNRVNPTTKVLLPTTEQNKLIKKTEMDVKPNSLSNFISQKRFLEGKYKDLAPIVKKTKAARLARDKAGGEVTKLIEELKLARARYNEHHQTYKNCIQQYLLLKANIEADTTTPPMENHKRANEDSVSLNKRQKIEDNSTIKSNPTPTIDKVQVQPRVITENLDVAEKEILPKEDVINEEKEKISDDTTLKAKRRSIDTNPLIEVCPFDLQGSCRDSECKYRHLGNND
ncbi:uncharacterized protein PFB0145c-like [Chrysoperla carnea]|uniref:uncharacterized protein PFB0145c-like n=1 Tax=Chrysoperla carnea TaxID=189513 RepID=UPI001D06450B|nr:uncharacterized protein PFB0145c-like [Chrysoperla carnea]